MNFSKRLIKSPKIYFYDTGLACSLLKITNIENIIDHYLKGGLFESMIISEILKSFYNRGKEPHAYFWRDSQGHEVDCIVENANQLLPIEIKAGHTITSDYFTNTLYWSNLSQTSPSKSFILYAGTDIQSRNQGNVISWRNVYETISSF